MSRTKYLKGDCQHCGEHLEFLADQIGMVVACPHCGKETELTLPRPPEEPAIPRRAIIWTGIAAVILCLGLAGALVALKRAQRLAEGQKQQNAVLPTAEAVASNTPAPEHAAYDGPEGITATAVTLDGTPGTSLIYAVGTLKNSSNRQRFGLKVELEVTDAGGQRIGTATDYRQVLEPGAEWQFKALVVASKAAGAKISAIHEER
jgi:hypothetical protein